LVNRPHDQSQNCFFPAWLGLVWFGLAKKNREALDPGWQFFPTAGFIAAVLVFGIPQHFLFVTRKKRRKTQAFRFHCLLVFVTWAWGFSRLLLFHMFFGKTANIKDRFRDVECPFECPLYKQRYKPKHLTIQLTY